MARRPASGEYWQLIHELNRRYQQAWDRAERLQAELDNIRGSRAWKVLRCLRWLKAMFVGRPAPARARAQAPCPAAVIDNLPAVSAGKVTIIVPFRNYLGLLRSLLRSLGRSTYRRFDVLLIDNGSTCRRTRQYLRRLAGRRRIRVAACPGRFNFARLCNVGAAQADGDFLLFLNNDMEVLTKDWLEQLLRVGAHAQVGIVGATLLYPDGTLQHAGLFPHGPGRWEHVYRGCPGDFPGACGELLQVREVPAVTGACLLIRRDLFAAVGGFAEDLPVTGNDVDLCRRVRARGLRVAVTPHARLLHAESLSRGYAREAQPSKAGARPA